MDYGYQLLRHAVRQVFGNLGQAARLTLLLAMAPTIFLAVTNTDLMTGGPGFDPSNPNAQQMPEVNWLLVLIGAILSVVAWVWAAVAWHRFVLLEEYASGPIPSWRGSSNGRYFIRALQVGLILVGAMIAMTIIIGLVVMILPGFGVGLILGIGLIIGISWVGTRVGLVLPAAAIDAPLSIGESWQVTGPVSGQILLPIIVIALVGGLLSQAVLVLFGVGIVAVLVSAVISWLQLLVNLALMTTLYGNLVEGRQLH
ncbi:hypothetical protein N0B44_09795 [Roseibacterium beibuensis]|uniref:Glycerophosphoryl diester phosphodiesterase membrane domain-containing protein n=1 Tax=[Roseibacterium] beibuensis TaxID=1193142 RepID=A0ABP9LGD0_9RHOB|nr:hypothetical protein [Roseibacterium beibuensis]MCS6623203.1 hypothetical protein [Roseibacterium beibuensis]